VMRFLNKHFALFVIVTLMLTCSSVSSRDLSLTPNVPANGGQAAQSDKPIAVAVLVTVFEANLRDKPSSSGTIINTVEKGDLLTLVSSNAVGPWYRVRANKSAPAVWIHGNAIALLYANASATESDSDAQRPRTTSLPVSGRSYVNVDGVRVPSPVFSDTKPAGASARCRDGSYSFSQNRRGTCSHHGGVAVWF
jgi:hypothetical protein